MSYTLDQAFADITRTTGLVFTRTTLGPQRRSHYACTPGGGLVFTHTSLGPQRSGHYARTTTGDAVVVTDEDEQALTDDGNGHVAPRDPRWPPIHPIVITIYPQGDLTVCPIAEVSTDRAEIAVLPHLLDQTLEVAARARLEHRDHLTDGYDGRGDNDRNPRPW